MQRHLLGRGDPVPASDRSSPLSGPRNQVFIGHLCVPPPAFSEKNPDVHVPPVVEALVLRCLEKDPKKRPASARALAEEFHRIVAPSSEPPHPIPTHWVRRYRAWMALVGVVGLGICVLLLPRIRPASPTEFSVTADPSSMELIAGGEAQPVRLQFVGCKPGTNVEVSFPDPLADVAMKQVGTFFGDLYEFQVAADLNARTDSRTDRAATADPSWRRCQGVVHSAEDRASDDRSVASRLP